MYKTVVLYITYMSNEPIKEIISHLREERIKKQFCRSELASKFRVPQSHISKIERK